MQSLTLAASTSGSSKSQLNHRLIAASCGQWTHLCCIVIEKTDRLYTATALHTDKCNINRMTLNILLHFTTELHCMFYDETSQAAQSRCPVLTATFKVNGRWQISTPYRMETTSPIANKNDTRDYVREATSCAKFGANPPAGVFRGDG